MILQFKKAEIRGRNNIVESTLHNICFLIFVNQSLKLYRTTTLRGLIAHFTKLKVSQIYTQVCHIMPKNE